MLLTIRAGGPFEPCLKRLFWSMSRTCSSTSSSSTSSPSCPSSPSSPPHLVRVRFAPSPTGFLHLGSLRTAFYNYLFARKHGGQFILRIEDTDQTRLVPGAVEAIQEVLSWAGLVPDEGPSSGGHAGPYLQSQRLALYEKSARQLLASGHAYRCFCSETKLNLIRKEAAKNREIPRYDNRCRHLTEDEVSKKLEEGQPFAVRLKLSEGPLTFDDLIFGQKTKNLSESEADPIILKSDGFPTYHLANVVDDHEMGITHVLRGVEWLSSTPKHIMMFRAFGWDLPAYAHLPLIMNKDGSKLSKRQDDLRVEYMRREGFFPEALVNFLTTVGGGFVGLTFEEPIIHSLERLCEEFSLNEINVNESRLDPERLRAYNRVAIKSYAQRDMSYLLGSLRKLVDAKFGDGTASQFEDECLTRLITWSLVRIYFLQDLVNEFHYIWVRPVLTWDPAKMAASLGPLEDILRDTCSLIEGLRKDDLKTPQIMASLRPFCVKKEINFKKYMQFLRLSLINEVEGPPVGEIYELLGPHKFIEYLLLAAEYVEKQSLVLINSHHE